MKKIPLLLLLALALAFSSNAQTYDTPEQKSALVEIGKLNGQVVTLFNQKNYDEALKIALDAWDIAEKNGLSNDVRALPSLANVAEIYFIKDKFSEAATAYLKILEVYQSSPGKTELQIAKTSERLALIYYHQKDYLKTEDFLFKALPLREKLNGAESPEMVRINNDLGNLYRKTNAYERASEFFLKAISINDKILTDEEKERREDLSNYECFLYHKGLREDNVRGASEQIKAFYAARKKPGDDKKPVNNGIVNGRAVKLVKPRYPSDMRGVTGFVLVQVTIDEQGDVVSAKATCGILQFVNVVEAAARRSKFSPTLLNDQPVKVTGTIVYNFVR